MPFSRKFSLRVPGWVGAAGIASGLFLSMCAGALPERLQDVSLYLGVGITFASIGGIMLSLAAAARPEWRGIATLAGVGLGVLPLLVLVVWHHLQNNQGLSMVRVARTASAAPRVSATPTPPRPTPPQPVPETHQQARVPAVADRETSDPVLAEVADILNNQVRPSLLNGLQLIRRPAAALQRDPQGFKSQLLSVTQDLEEARASLDRIGSADEKYRLELATIVGDTTALDGLISALRSFGDSLDSADAATVQQSSYLLQTQRAQALFWVNGCNQRIAGRRMAVGTEKPASGA